MSAFQYDSPVLAAYPDLVGGVIVAEGLHSGPSPDALKEAFAAEQKAVLERIGDKPLSEIPSLAAWRTVFRSFGVDPTQYRSAAEALLRRLTKKGDIPSINLLVDIGNLVSIRYGLPVAVVDRRAIVGSITVHFADGSEVFKNLNQSEVDHPVAGEVIFSDEQGNVVARRWCWRQSDESAAGEDTTRALITVEGHHKGAAQDIQAALTDLCDLLGRFSGGQFESTVLVLDPD